MLILCFSLHQQELHQDFNILVTSLMLLTASENASILKITNQVKFDSREGYLLNPISKPRKKTHAARRLFASEMQFGNAPDVQIQCDIAVDCLLLHATPLPSIHKVFVKHKHYAAVARFQHGKESFRYDP